MKRPKIDTSGTEAAQKAIADATVAANNIRQNMSADLTNENLATVVPGGGAPDIGTTGTRKKRNASAGLASQLGIQV